MIPRMSCMYPSASKRARRIISLLVAIIALSGSSMLRAATDSADVFATVIATLSLVNQTPLSFGEVAPSNTPGTVILNPDGSRLTTGGAFINSTVAGSSAAFDGSGLPNAVYAITLPVSVVLTGASGNSMVVDGFTSQPVDTGLTDAGGEQNLFVGGTLNVNANQPVGDYRGEMSVTVVYN